MEYSKSCKISQRGACAAVLSSANQRPARAAALACFGPSLNYPTGPLPGQPCRP
ncbi:hypothetical protein ANAEL_02497 [Anaerolineales bacterium]|nr:hypothetical protein ANAEL_02497 [Anaerolineales bacterium]